MGWLELIGTSSDGILHRSDCTLLCCLLCQLEITKFHLHENMPGVGIIINAGII